MASANEVWLEDMSLKLLCVFALDRFGDFVTDEVNSLVHSLSHTVLVILIIVHEEKTKEKNQLLHI